MSLLYDEKEDWSFEKLDAVYDKIESIALGELKLNVYPNQIEIIDAEKMLDAYSSMAMPLYYRHWSLGKSFIANQKSYEGGYSNLAYEVVINSNPCISYLQESNDMTMQTLVIAHAAFGHNAVFKNNEHFVRWTQADSILDELNFAKQFIARCEERYGAQEVEAVLDAAHALMDHGVDTHPRRPKSRQEKSAEFQMARRFDERLESYDLLWEKTVGAKEERAPLVGPMIEEGLGEENLLYFIEKNAPGVPQWKREVLRIVRKIAQYFYPQGLTKVLNEGFATMTHYYCLQRLHQLGCISDGALFGAMSSHTNVIAQPDFDAPHYSGLNPYALGFHMLRDVRRICENPTSEDLQYLPHLKGKHWLDAWHQAMNECSDSTFISQYLSPKVMRDLKLFVLADESAQSHYEVKGIHDEAGYEYIRSYLSENYTLSARVPLVTVEAVNYAGDRSLHLKYHPYKGRPLDESSKKMVMEYAQQLWGYPVHLR